MENWEEALDDDELVFSATAEVEAPPREPTVRVVEQEQLTRIPGTRGDALRAIEVMPGVGRTPFAANDGAPLLRGSGNDESLVLLDGAQVPLIYHFGGLTSFFNSHLLEAVELTPGNYSARYGRAVGGLIEARVRDPRTDGFHAMLELSAIDSFALAETPLSSKTAIALAARRSNIDLFFDALVPEDSFSVLAAPVYWDYQAILTHRFSEQTKLRVMAYGSHDQLELFFDDAAAEDPAIRGSVEAKWRFHRGQIELDSQLSDAVSQRFMLSMGPSLGEQRFGELDAEFNLLDVNARAEWSVVAHPKLRIDAGFDGVMFVGTGRYKGPPPDQYEGNPNRDSLAAAELIELGQDTVTPIRPAVYVEASYRPTEGVLLVPGVRADYVVDGEDLTVDPRLSGRFSVTESTTLKSGVGLYSQPPEYFQLMDELGNPDAEPFRTIQSTAGVEQVFGRHFSVDAEAFYKIYQNRLIATEGGAPPRFVNEGTGRAYGLELLADLRGEGKTRALLAYTLSRSERKDGDAPRRLFDSDQTHNISLTANYDFGRGWVAGARFRYVTGDPITPVLGSVYDANSDTYRALYGEVNSDRNRAFHQLDVRVEKLWELGPVGLTTYLEVLNAYNAKNEEGIAYSYDFSESSGVTSMPIFPNLGIRGEF